MTMLDTTHQSIVDAIDALASGTPRKSDGKITAVNLAREAGISKAGLYRYFKLHSELEESFKILRRNGIRIADEPPTTIQQAYLLLQNEVKQLRNELKTRNVEYENSQKIVAQKIFLLKQHNKKLTEDLARLKWPQAHKSQNPD